MMLLYVRKACMVPEFVQSISMYFQITSPGTLLDAQVVILVRLVCDLSNSFIIDMNIMRRIRKAFLAEVVDGRRGVLFDRRQKCGGDARIDVEFAIEEFRIRAF